MVTDTNAGEPRVGVMALSELSLGQRARVRGVGGGRGFRRRLMELGLTPGVEVELVAVAPFGDPLQVRVRGGKFSIRAAEAKVLMVVR